MKIVEFLLLIFLYIYGITLLSDRIGYDLKNRSKLTVKSLLFYMLLGAVFSIGIILTIAKYTGYYITIT